MIKYVSNIALTHCPVGRWLWPVYSLQQMTSIYNKMSCIWEVCLNREKWLKWKLLRALLVGFLIAPSKNRDGVCGASSYVRNCSMSVLDVRTQVIPLKKRVGFTTVFFLRMLTLFLSPIVFTLSLRCKVISVNDFPVNFDAAVWPIWTALSQFAEGSATTPVAIDQIGSQQMADVPLNKKIIVFLVPSLSWWCCSEVSKCTPVNYSIASHTGAHWGKACTHAGIVLSVIPL